MGVGLAEDVDLQTSYPSPPGLYEMIETTNDTFLAENAGGVAIGSLVAPAAGVKLEVTGDTVVTGTIRIGGGDPEDGEVLTSDAAGNATWAEQEVFYAP